MAECTRALSPVLQLLTAKASKTALNLGQLDGTKCDLASALRVSCQLQLVIWSIIIGRAFKYALQSVFDLFDTACGLELLIAIGFTVLSVVIIALLLGAFMWFFKCIQASLYDQGRKLVGQTSSKTSDSNILLETKPALNSVNST